MRPGGQPEGTRSVATVAPRRRPPPVVTRIFRELRSDKPMAAGVILLLLLALASIFAPLLTSKDPQALSMGERLEPPSVTQWFGTDGFGRDVYTRTVFGGRISLAVGIITAIVSGVVGVSVGTLSGYFRKVDAVIMRIVDGLMSIPNILIGISLVALLGASLQNVLIALILTESPRMVRVARASVLSLREQVFVEAAESIGASPPRIMALHIVPNLVAPMLVMGTFITAQAILLEATLSFLGAGTPPSTPSWGNIMAESKDVMQQAVWTIMFPGFFLAVTVLAVNLVGDGLRDAADPRTSRVARPEHR